MSVTSLCLFASSSKEEVCVVLQLLGLLAIDKSNKKLNLFKHKKDLPAISMSEHKIHFNTY